MNSKNIWVAGIAASAVLLGAAALSVWQGPKTPATTFMPGDTTPTTTIAAPTTTSPTPVQSDGSIRGQATLGPMCPVMRNPPDPACADKPYQASLELTTADGAKVVRQFATDAKGMYALSVPPGVYAIRTAASGSIYPRCASNRPIIVQKGIVTEANISCDTGIR